MPVSGEFVDFIIDQLPEGVEVTYPANRRVLFIELKEAKETEEEEEA